MYMFLADFSGLSSRWYDFYLASFSRSILPVPFPQMCRVHPTLCSCLSSHRYYTIPLTLSLSFPVCPTSTDEIRRLYAQKPMLPAAQNYNMIVIVSRSLLDVIVIISTI